MGHGTWGRGQEHSVVLGLGAILHITRRIYYCLNCYCRVGRWASGYIGYVVFGLKGVWTWTLSSGGTATSASD